MLYLSSFSLSPILCLNCPFAVQPLSMFCGTIRWVHIQNFLTRKITLSADIREWMNHSERCTTSNFKNCIDSKNGLLSFVINSWDQLFWFDRWFVFHTRWFNTIKWGPAASLFWIQCSMLLVILTVTFGPYPDTDFWVAMILYPLVH